MKILVLGAAGFIGSHLTERLLASGRHEVHGFDIEQEKIDGLRDQPGFHFIQGDLRWEAPIVKEMVSESDVVIDLIAHANPSPYIERPLDVFHLNFNENVKIAEWCVEADRRLIQFSTCEVYGKTVASVAGDHLDNPEAPIHAHFAEDQTDFILGPVCQHRWIYACAKQLLERVLHAMGMKYGMNWSVVRPFNFIGPKIDYLPHEQKGNPRVFSHFMTALLTGERMPLVDGGHHKRCFTYISDAIDCIVRLVEDPEASCQQIFNIGNPRNEMSIRDMAHQMREIFEEKFAGPDYRQPEIVEVPAVEFYGEGYEDSDRRIPNIDKARNLLGWEPTTDLHTTLEKSMEYYARRELHSQSRAGGPQVVREDL